MNADDAIFFPLRNALFTPVKGVVSSPNSRAYFEIEQAKLFAKFAPKPLFDALSRLQSAAGRDPPTLTATGSVDSHEKDLLLRRQQHGSDGISIDYHHALFRAGIVRKLAAFSRWIAAPPG